MFVATWVHLQKSALGKSIYLHKEIPFPLGLRIINKTIKYTTYWRQLVRYKIQDTKLNFFLLVLFIINKLSKNIWFTVKWYSRSLKVKNKTHDRMCRRISPWTWYTSSPEWTEPSAMSPFPLILLIFRCLGQLIFLFQC